LEWYAKNKLILPGFRRRSEQPHQSHAITMDMKTVRKALPNDLFQIVLKLFKKRQVNKIDYLNQYVFGYLAKLDKSYGEEDPWYDYLDTNAETESAYKQESILIERAKHERQILKNMRSTFDPIPIYRYSDSEVDKEEPDYQEWLDYMDSKVSGSDDDEF
jgi:hypothetical protein